MKYAVEVLVYGDEEFCGNGLRFDTELQAREYGEDLFSRWTSVKEWRVVENFDDEPEPTPEELRVEDDLDRMKEADL